jgi:hypothetical protein
VNNSQKKSSPFTVIIFIVVVTVAVSLFWKPKRKAKVQEVAQPTVQTKKKPKSIKKSAPAPVVVAAPQTAPIQQINVVAAPAPTKTRQIPKDHVEFELLGNKIAVAFGDVILGRLESEMKTPRGLFKPPKSRLWSTNVIPFLIKEGTPNTQKIAEALKYFNENTNVQFVLRTDEKDGILFEGWDEKRCASYVGTVGGLQPIFIGPDCGTQEVLHEIMHALGFVHEQSRVDRDNYVRILWDNIMEGFANQFDIIPDVYFHPYTGSVFNFDYESVMLYRPESFAKTPGLKTIEAIGNGKIAPVTQGLSARDLERLHYLYGN